MKENKELSGDISMHYHNVHGKVGRREVRIHERTTFLARERVVEYRKARTEQRFLRFLPLKHTETKAYLRIPGWVTTEDQLWDYVEKRKPFWLDRASRR